MVDEITTTAVQDDDDKMAAAWWSPLVFLIIFGLIGLWIYDKVKVPVGADHQHAAAPYGTTDMTPRDTASETTAAAEVAAYTDHDEGAANAVTVAEEPEAAAPLVEPSEPRDLPEIVAESILPAAPFVRRLGDFELRGAQDGVEADLLAFIDSDNAPCTEGTCWFSFDRLTFTTGSSDLDMAVSADQLENIYQIMRAYPEIELKFGGYTDNRGNEAFNVALSQRRAEAVAAALIARGIAEQRFGAEGYGSQFPRASNETTEGRAMNRRVDVRLRKR